MRKIIIKIKDRIIVDDKGRELVGLNAFVLEHNATQITLDFTGMGVDQWEKCVDFETSNGVKLQYRYGFNVKEVITIPTDVLEAGKLKINPFAVNPNTQGGYDRVSGNIFVIGVGEIVDAFEAGPPNIGEDSFSQIKERLDNFKESDLPIEDFVDRFALKFEVYTKTEVDTITSDIYEEIIDVKDLAEGNKISLDELTGTVIPGLELTKADRTELLLKADKATTYSKNEVDSLIDGVDLSGYYKKTEVDTKLDNKADKSTTYTKTEVYNKAEVDSLIDGVEVDLTDYYKKTEVDTELNLKADKTNTYTKAEIDQKLTEPLIFENLIENGDFSDGTNRWITSRLSLTTSNNKGHLFFETDVLAYPNINQIIENKSGDMYFVSFEISENMNDKVGCRFQLGTQTYLTFSGNGIKSRVFTSNNNTGFVYLNHIVQMGGTINYKVTNFILLNLTQTFGAGNEPTKEEMDEIINIIGWFDNEYAVSNKEVFIALRNLKADKATTYTKTEVDALVSGEVDLTDYYKKTEVDTKLNLKSDKASTYTKIEIDQKLDNIVGGDIDLSNYYNKQETYSKSEVDGKISDITIGGRNYLLDSGVRVDFEEQDIIPTTVEEYLPTDGGRNYVLNSKRVEIPLNVAYREIPFVGNQGEPVSISYKELVITGGEPSSGGVIIALFRRKNSSPPSYQTFIIQTATKKISAPLDFDVDRVLLYKGASNQESLARGGYYEELKIEKGSTPTPWTPAPEDFNGLKGKSYALSQPLRKENIISLNGSFEEDDFIGLWLGNDKFVGFLDNKELTFNLTGNYDDEFVVVKTLSEKGITDNAKLEKGDIATDWTPAPEDMAYKVDTYTKAEVDALIDGVEVDLSGYYTKVETDSSFGLKADKATTYTKTEVNALIEGVEVDLSGYYTKGETDSALGLKADKSELDNKADKATTYTKTETDSAIALKADKATTYSKAEVNALIDGVEVDLTNYYKKTEVDTELGLKADKATTYTKTEVDTANALKADKSSTYTKTEVNNALDLKANVSTVGELSDVVTQNVTRIGRLEGVVNRDNFYRVRNLLNPGGFPINFMHRGYSGSFPENTMLAFEKAVRYGAKGIELDIHVTSDSKIVVIHDSTVDRTTNGTGTVASKTLAQIKALNIDGGNGWDSDIFASPGMPTLKVPELIEVLPFLMKTGTHALIEMKGNWTDAQVRYLFSLIDQYKVKDMVGIMSQNLSHIAQLRRLDPVPNVNYLVGLTVGLLSEEHIQDAIDYTECFISMSFDSNADNLEIINEILPKEIPVTMWTINAQFSNDLIRANGWSVTTDNMPTGHTNIQLVRHSVVLSKIGGNILVTNNGTGGNSAISAYESEYYKYSIGTERLKIISALSTVSSTALGSYLTRSSGEKWRDKVFYTSSETSESCDLRITDSTGAYITWASLVEATGNQWFAVFFYIDLY